MKDRVLAGRSATLEDREPIMSVPSNPESLDNPNPFAPLDPLVFRTTMGLFATGITVVTTRTGATLHGITVNAFMSVSLDPPLIMVAIDKRARAHAFLQQGGAFAINFLAEDQEAISDRFAGRGAFRSHSFEDIAFTPGLTGAPLIGGTLGSAECRVWTTYEGGDHTLFVGEVVALHRNETIADTKQPLLYYRSRYGLPSYPESA